MPSGPRVTLIQSRATRLQRSAKVIVATTKACVRVRRIGKPNARPSSALTTAATSTPLQKLPPASMTMIAEQ